MVARYNKELLPVIIPMRPYLDEKYDKKMAEKVIKNYNIRGFKFRDLTTQLLFEKYLTLLKPKG